MQIRIGDRNILTISSFLGAGWSWPCVRIKPWCFLITFHCGKGLLIMVGWDENNIKFKQQLREILSSMSPEEQQKVLEAFDARK